MSRLFDILQAWKASVREVYLLINQGWILVSNKLKAPNKLLHIDDHF